jgi:hypothetical protein
MLLILTGRRTGRTLTIPVGRHEEGGALLVHARGAWRHNLHGGADVRVVLDGRERPAHADYEDRPDEVVRQYRDTLERLGYKQARLLGLKVNVPRSPTAAELAPAIAGRGVARIRLKD